MANRLPTLVIVGRPNVGKSTMFNRIVKRRIAVVQDQPGVTRDRLYSEATHEGKRFNVVDTGGILFGDEDPLVDQIRVQAEVALSEADSILFVVDAVEGMNPHDWDLANRLRGFPKPVYIVANKADNKDRSDAAMEFHALGLGEVYPVSSIQDKGLGDLLDIVLEGFPKIKDFDVTEHELKLAIIGRPNVGKSSMLNAFTGEKRAIVSNIPGTTRDAIDTPVMYKDRKVRLIDTAGIRRRGKYQGSVEYYMVHRAEQAIRRAECALLVIDGHEGLTDGDKRVGKIAHDEGKPLVIAVNKWDLIEPPTGNLGKITPQKKEFIKQLRDHLPECSYSFIRFTSAAESTGMDGVMNAVFTSHQNWSYRVSTGIVNRIIQDAVFERPLARRGQAIKVKYVTQPDTCPPTFIVFCNKPDLLHFSYQRYLENCLRKALPLEGTPIRLKVKASSKQDQDD